MTDEQIITPVPDPPPARPRFRLQHLFILITVIAVMLTIAGPQPEPAGAGVSLFQQQVNTGYELVRAILGAIALTAVGYGLYWRRQGRRFLDQPGHWLLIEAAFSALLVGYVHVVLRLVTGQGWKDASFPTTATWVWLVYVIAPFVELATVNIYFGSKQRDPRWR